MYDPDKDCREMITVIKGLCEQKKITPRTLAKKAGISTSTLSYLLNGRTKPQICTVLMICNVLDVTIGELFDTCSQVPAENQLSSEITKSEMCAFSGEEETILDCYRHLSDEKKKLLRIYIDMLTHYEDELPEDEC